MKKLIIALTAVVFSADALAKEVDDAENSVTLTVSPLHLFAPIIEVTGEYKLNKNLGLSLIAGHGRISSTIDGDLFSVREYGMQINYYPGSNFSAGIHYGVEFMKIDVKAEMASNIKGSGSAVGFGPYVGYKYLTGSGLTFVSQLGFQSYNITAEAHDSNGNSANAAGESGGILLNLNMGYSF